MSLRLVTRETPWWRIRMGCPERGLAMVELLGYHKF